MTCICYVYFISLCMKKKIKPPYQVRMSDELYEKAQKSAKSLGLSFAAYVRMLVSKEVDKR